MQHIETVVHNAIRNIRLAVAGHSEWPTGRVEGLAKELTYDNHSPEQVVDIRLAVAAAVHEFGGYDNVPDEVWRVVAGIGCEIHAAEFCGDPDVMGGTAQGAFFIVPFHGISKGHPLINAIEAFGGMTLYHEFEDTIMEEGPNKTWVDTVVFDLVEFIGRKVDGRLVIDVINHRWDETTNKFHHLLLLGGAK